VGRRLVMAPTLFIELKKRDPEAVIDVLATGLVAAHHIARMPEVERGIAGTLARGK